ncbi:hypothetical protein NDU88_005965 [Pleurodeles waltl]|uniref:Uncharacterized protein n=1 Tax=Pleurodeles waltl TaxID=8319 RepID=A0AAV7RLR7_PLEWA|nr:hypothetical protein NDU88_005965 [Pleurodeles waltl]
MVATCSTNAHNVIMRHQASAHLVQEQIRGLSPLSIKGDRQSDGLQTTEPAVWPDARTQAGETITKLRSTAKYSDEDFQRERDKETRDLSVVIRSQRTHQDKEAIVTRGAASSEVNIRPIPYESHPTPGECKVYCQDYNAQSM